MDDRRGRGGSPCKIVCTLDLGEFNMNNDIHLVLCVHMYIPVAGTTDADGEADSDGEADLAKLYLR